MIKKDWVNSLSVDLFSHMVCRDEEGGGRGGYTDAPILVKKGLFCHISYINLEVEKTQQFYSLEN